MHEASANGTPKWNIYPVINQSTKTDAYSYIIIHPIFEICPILILCNYLPQLSATHNRIRTQAVLLYTIPHNHAVLSCPGDVQKLLRYFDNDHLTTTRQAYFYEQNWPHYNHIIQWPIKWNEIFKTLLPI